MLLLALYLAVFGPLPQVLTPAQTPQIEQQQQSPEEEPESSDESEPAEEITIEVDNQIPEVDSVETDNGFEGFQNVPSNWIIVMFTGILALVALFQWRTSVIQGKILRSTERAYMQTVQWKLHNFAPEKLLSFSFTAKNFGRTPAVVLKITSASTYTVGPPESFPVMNVVNEGRTLINSGSGLKKEARIFPPLSQQLHERVQKGEVTLWNYVELSYLDVFKVKRVYRTCMKYDPERKLLVTAPEAKFDDAS